MIGSPCRLPAFLLNATEEYRQKFREIFRNSSLTKGEIEAKLDEWAKSQGGAVLAAFEKERAARANFKAKITETMAELAADKSADARAIIRKIEEIRNDSTLTVAEEMWKIFAVMQETSETIRAEIWNLQKDLIRAVGFLNPVPSFRGECACLCGRRPTPKGGLPNAWMTGWQLNQGRQFRRVDRGGTPFIAVPGPDQSLSWIGDEGSPVGGYVAVTHGTPFIAVSGPDQSSSWIGDEGSPVGGYIAVTQFNGNSRVLPYRERRQIAGGNQRVIGFIQGPFAGNPGMITVGNSGGPFGGNQGPFGGKSGSFGGNNPGGLFGGGKFRPIGVIQGPFGGNQGPLGGNQGPFGGNQGPFGGNQGPFGGNQGPGPFGGNQGPGPFGGNQGPFGGNQGPFGGKGPFGGNQGPFGGNQGQFKGPGPFGGRPGPPGGNQGQIGIPITGGNTGPSGGFGGFQMGAMQGKLGSSGPRTIAGGNQFGFGLPSSNYVISRVTN